MTRLVADAIRPFWFPGINAVTGKQIAGVAQWIAEDDYQVYQQIAVDRATLAFVVPDTLVKAYAADLGRYAAAAVESMEGIARSPRLPKASAWVAIRAYYAGFFAAHAILRSIGVSCTQFDPEHATRITDVADAFGSANGVALTRGLYELVVDSTGKAVGVVRADATGGSHVGTWRVFLRELRRISAGVLSSGMMQTDALRIAAKLAEIEYSISDGGGSGSGAWMSVIRNRVNYRLEFDAWFPYGRDRSQYDEIFERSQRWDRDPMTLTISTRRGRELHRLVDTAVLLVAIVRELCLDLEARCPRGRSFQQYSCVSMLNLLDAA